VLDCAGAETPVFFCFVYGTTEVVRLLQNVGIVVSHPNRENLRLGWGTQICRYSLRLGELLLFRFVGLPLPLLNLGQVFAVFGDVEAVALDLF
jgi:hypothetical protein